jgi:uncharacterized membrane protein
MSFLLWLEQTGVGQFVRESRSLLGYPTFTVLHTFGLSVVVGISAMIAVRLAGIAPGIPLAPLRSLFPIVWAGFVINLISGSGLAAAAASTTIPSPMFVAKITFVIIAVVLLRKLQVSVFNDPDVDKKPLDKKSKLMGGALLCVWLFAMICGRLIGYTVDVLPPLIGP